VLRQHNLEDLPPPPAQRLEEHALLRPLVPTGRHRPGQDDQPGKHAEERHEAHHLREPAEEAVEHLQHQRQVNRQHVRELPRDGLLEARRGGFAPGAAENGVGLRGLRQRAGREDHKEVRLHTLPVHFAQARRARGDRHPLHVEGKRVPETHVEVACDVLLDGDGHHVAGPIVALLANERAGGDPLGVDQVVAVGGAEVVGVRPLVVAGGFDFFDGATLHAVELHRHDGDGIEHGQILLAHRLRHAFHLVGLHIEEDDIRAPRLVGHLELFSQRAPGQQQRQDEKRPEAQHAHQQARLVAGAVQVRQSLPPGVRQRRQFEGPRGAHDAGCQQRQEREDGDHAARVAEPQPPVRRELHREARRAGGNERPHAPPQPPVRARLLPIRHVGAERPHRRDAAHLQERQEREE
jgi:hypothetical protein